MNETPWEAVPKLKRGPKALSFPAVKLVLNRSQGTQRFSLNPLAKAQLGREVVLLRNGDRLGLRRAREDDDKAVVRRVSLTQRGATIAIGHLGQLGTVYRLVEGNDMWVLEPLKEDPDE